jgi:hypothetical protein
LGEVAPFQLRRTVFIPPTLLCWALSWSGPGVAVGVAVAVGIAVAVGLGEGVGVGVALCAAAQYLPPVFKPVPPKFGLPPQAIISLPVHTAV